MMLLEALKYLIGLANPEIVSINGKNYSHREMIPIKTQRIETLELGTLDAFLAFCKMGERKKETFIIIDKSDVILLSRALTDNHFRQEYCLYESKDDLTEKEILLIKEVLKDYTILG